VQYTKMEYGLAEPIVNASADFLAAKDITFQVADDEDTTGLCADIWTDSGGTAAFLENAINGAMLGDAVILIQKKEDDERAYLKWLDPCVCFPIFDPHDCERLLALTIAYQIPAPVGHGVIDYREEWVDGTVTIKENGIVTGTDTYDQELFGGEVPAVWIRNQKRKGEVYGRSDLQCCDVLIEKYNHQNVKQDKIIDYYSSPNIMVKGVNKRQFEMTKGERTVYFLPADGDMGFVEWQGTAQTQAVEAQINRCRETISEVSETPQAAFSQLPTGLGDVTGIALRLMMGPLLKKTDRKRGSWGPCLEKAMWFALLVEGKKVDLEALSITWPDPLPTNLVEFWQIATQKDAMGVPKKQILREANYSEDQIEEFEAEKDEEIKSLGEQALSLFDKGMGPGSSTYKQPKPGQIVKPPEKKDEKPASKAS
jgi:hypothetical protein